MATQRSTDNIDVPNRREVAWGLAPSGYNPQADDHSGYIANATVNAYRIVKFDTSDSLVIQGAAATDTTIGINQSPQAASAGQAVMLALQGVGKVELGGTVTRGDLLSTDSVGRAVVSLAAPTDRVIGVALQSGAIGDIIRVSISPSKNGGVT